MTETKNPDGGRQFDTAEVARCTYFSVAALKLVIPPVPQPRKDNREHTGCREPQEAGG